MFKKEKIYLA